VTAVDRKGTMNQVTVRYFAAAQAAAGMKEELVDLPDGGTVADLLDRVRSRHGEQLSRVLARSSFLLDAAAVRDPLIVAGPRSTLDVLPPFAGG
jgi:molybdopterin converting factor small subunit